MTPFPDIRTARLQLRAPGPDDLEQVVGFYTSERAVLAGGTCSQPEAVTRFLALLGHWAYRGYGLFAVDETATGRTVGMVGPYFPPGRPETEIGWVLFDGEEGQGFATEAAQAAMTYAREVLNWTSIVHYIDSNNSASIAVAERLGSRLDPNAAKPARKVPGDTLVYRQVEAEAMA